MYLTNRDPLPININPQLTFHDDPIPSKNNQVRLRACSPCLLAVCACYLTLAPYEQRRCSHSLLGLPPPFPPYLPPSPSFLLTP